MRGLNGTYRGLNCEPRIVTGAVTLAIAGLQRNWDRDECFLFAGEDSKGQAEKRQTGLFDASGWRDSFSVY